MKKLIFLVIIISLFHGCISEHSDYFKVSEEDKSFYDFNIGSSWTYIEDSTKTLEKITVLSRDLSSYYTGHIDSNDEYGEKIITVYTSTFSNTKYIQTMCSGGYRSASYFTCENYTNDTLVYKDNLLLNKDTLISLNILGKNYANVRYVRGYNKEYVNEYWIAKNIGIIKKIIKTSNRSYKWYLKESLIIQ